MPVAASHDLTAPRPGHHHVDIVAGALAPAQPFLQLAQAAQCSSPQFSHAPCPCP